MRGVTKLVIGVAILVVMMAGAAWADSIAIANSSFENPVYGDNGYSFNVITGWTISGGDAGVYNPTTGTYPGEAPDGQEVAWLHGGATISQELSATLALETVYDLSAEVGRRADGVPAVSYEVQLWAGNQMLASTNNPLPGAGAFVPVSLRFVSDDSYSALAGQSLVIKLVNTADVASWPYQVNFDNVGLNTAPSPEPGTLVMMGTGMLGAAGYARRKLLKR